MPRVGFEHTIPVFERAKTFRALDRGATVIGQLPTFSWLFNDAVSIETIHCR
jgi:hypothetical protein